MSARPSSRFLLFFLCPITIHLTLTVGDIATWDMYNTIAEYVVGPLHAVWLIALTAPRCAGLTRTVLMSAPLRALGEISYSLYCVHASVLYATAWVVKGAVSAQAAPLVTVPNATNAEGLFCVPPWAIFPVLVAALALAIIVYYLVEKPMRTVINKWTQKPRA
jgi:peptidoglycan/LPS O-acetylase OafA/YrhL